MAHFSFSLYLCLRLVINVIAGSVGVLSIEKIGTYDICQEMSGVSPRESLYGIQMVILSDGAVKISRCCTMPSHALDTEILNTRLNVCSFEF